METVLKYLIDSLENGNILVAFLVIAVAMIFKSQEVFDFFEKIKESKNKSLKEIITIDHLSEDVKSIIQERLNTLSFHAATGIYAENPLRGKIIEKYNESKGEMTLHQIKMAMPHIKLKNGEIKVEVGMIDKIEFYLINLGSLTLVLFSLLLILVPATSKNTSVSQLLSIYGLAVIFFMCGGVMFKSSLPVVFAKKIKPHIENNNKKS